ncbi:MAG: hypothetical protein IJI54_05725 [Kiritimatiellae bacterium]|nr:hypothetical protein [Kiritimatiellia bacterium]MBQ6140768.1 hypothetical protein [Kiritimatiellia bacterium]
MATRQGKHKEGKTLLGAYVTPEFKALVIMTCDATGMSITDLLMDGVRRRAMSEGIIDAKGEITPGRREAYELVLETVKLAAKAKKGEK